MYFIVMPRVNLIVILMTYVCYLYSINYPTIICLPSMLLFILWRDTTSELWTLVHSFTLLLLFSFYLFYLHSCKLLYHLIHLILYSQQTGEIDNLTVSWDKVLGCVVCRFHIVAGEKLHADKFSGAIVPSVAKLADNNLWKFGSFSYWFNKPWFHN
jgi:hypothetical protein